ncbi:mercuric reductase [Pedobacter sp. GSP4]|uniref:mercuric reductase n=1 Tax=Pedobacter sp. GSP4 TaxID=3453716 RepID=UPI003EEB5738
MKHYDAIVIGAGQAGVPLAKKLAMAGKKTALIEKRLIGGTCINDGCTPTKAMVASARLAYQSRKSSALGVTIPGEIKVDLKAIMTRKNLIVKQFREGAEKGIAETKGLDLYEGEAKFTAEKEIIIYSKKGKEERISGTWIFINTGASPAVPDIPGLEEVPYLNSTTIMEIKEIPEHLIVVGGGYIALEFGQMFRRFGSQVTILEKSDRLLAHEDEDISASIKDILEKEEIKILTDTEIGQIKKVGGKHIEVEIKHGGKPIKLKGSHLLIAAGRKPQTEKLNLEKCGVKLNGKGYIAVNGQLETNIKGIYALGDVNGGPAFTHIAYNDYTIVYRNLIEGTDYNTADRPIPYCMFTDPQLARVGISENQAKAQNLQYKVAVLPMTSVARGIETGETLGLMKAIVDVKSKKILGAAIIGAEGGEVMSVLQMAMEGGITFDRIRYCVFAHPTYSESLNNLFMKIQDL